MDEDDIRAHIDAFEDYAEHYWGMLQLPNGEDSYRRHREEIARAHRWQNYYEGMLEELRRA